MRNQEGLPIKAVRSGTYSVPRCLHLGINHRRRILHKEGSQIVETAVEARGGFLGLPVLGVLITSLALTIGMFAIVYVAFFSYS
jgi:hypothetical protein